MNGYSFGLELGTQAPHQNCDGPIWAKKKEEPIMQVTYNGFTGELVKLEDVKFLGGVVTFGE